MSQAHVTNIDSLKLFRAALIKFAQAGNVALAAGDSEIDRTLGWLEREQTVYWTNQLRKRHAEVIRCEDALRQKRIFKAADGSTQSVVDETKAVQKARRSREEAEQKTVAVKKAIQLLQRESMLYKGRIQALATVLQADVPRAVHQLDVMMDQLDAYLAIQTSGSGLALNNAVESIASAAASVRTFGYERLRAETPNAAQRAASPPRSIAPSDSIFQTWGVVVLEEWQRNAIARLSIDRQALEPEQRVVILPDAWKQPRLYLERSEAAFEADSGWFLGQVDHADEPIAAFESVRAGDLIAAQPNIGHLLSLPIGFLIVLDAAGPVAILDPAGVDIWALALAASSDEQEQD